MKKILVIVDMQNDFVGGALGTEEAKSILPKVEDKIRKFDGDGMYLTLDTHGEDYRETLEGKKLPIPHCIEGSVGHRLCEGIEKALEGKKYTAIKKNTFGSFKLAEAICKDFGDSEIEIDICGLCTDICVVSNALILRAAFPNAEITLDASCCAGVTEKKHNAALETMRSCQIDVVM